MSPHVSVVVPTYRRPELLGRCLTALAAQTMMAHSYEILVADDAADPATRRQVEELAAKATCAIRRRWPPLDYYGIILSVVSSLLAAILGNRIACAVAVAVWAVLMGRFQRRRLHGTSRRPGHVLEMLVTSLFIPFLSVYWRLYGAAKFRVWFW